jgi:hypothetical protein
VVLAGRAWGLRTGPLEVPILVRLVKASQANDDGVGLQASLLLLRDAAARRGQEDLARKCEADLEVIRPLGPADRWAAVTAQPEQTLVLLLDEAERQLAASGADPFVWVD